jgi:hypothetical protein
MMITNYEIAKQLCNLGLELFCRLDESLGMVKESCAPEEYASYHAAVGRIVAPLVHDVLMPLYRDHPTLKPPGWDDEQRL